LILAAVIVIAAVWSALRNDNDSASSGGKQPQTVEGDAPGAGRQAPDFTLARLTGKGQVSLGEFRGQVVLVNFWASWCIPCRKEFPALRTAVDRHPEVAVIGITYRDIPSDARAFARDQHASWILLEGGDGDPVAKAYGIRAVPQLYVLDKDGKIVKRIFGGASESEIDAAIAQAKRTG
jgi:cytochrome c biogenesis protein CcmG/thiol:disulfide interchange protein DsbE